MRHFELIHRTTCTYPDTVDASYGRVLLLPRQLDAQRVHQTQVVVDPGPREQHTHADDSGNRATWFHVSGPHTRLTATASSLLSVERPFVSTTTLPRLPWDQVVALVRGVRTTGSPGDGTHPSPVDVLDITSAVLPSDLVPLSEDTQALGLDTFVPGQSLADAVAALASRIHREFTLGTEGAPTALSTVMATRRGTCQDLTHLMIAALRSLGLAALYVSGYLELAPGATHAWVTVWFPGAGWVHVDPTNGSFIDDRYIVLSRGRDSRDVAPLRGLAYVDDGGPTLSATVQLRQLSVEELAALMRTAGVDA